MFAEFNTAVIGHGEAVPGEKRALKAWDGLRTLSISGPNSRFREFLRKFRQPCVCGEDGDSYIPEIEIMGYQFQALQPAMGCNHLIIEIKGSISISVEYGVDFQCAENAIQP